MVVRTLAQCVGHRAVLTLMSDYPATVREITAMTGEAGVGAWLRPLGSEPLQIGLGAEFGIDVTEEIQRQFPADGQPQSYTFRLDISTEPKQDVQGGRYRLDLGPDGSVTKFENIG